MSISLSPLDVRGRDREALIAFLTRNRFPFHVTPMVSEDVATRRVDSGAYDGEGVATLWIDEDPSGHIGVVILSGLDENVPLFDLRLDATFRGHGRGIPVLMAITDHVFRIYPGVTRFGGRTREDNIAMRQIFVRCGWVKEAHYREAWPVEGGLARAGTEYAILRRDWESGITTPVRFDDLGY